MAASGGRSHAGRKHLNHIESMCIDTYINAPFHTPDAQYAFFPLPAAAENDEILM